MARLRIRIELSRGGVGVPLRKLASVMVESQKFLNLLTEDVRVANNGEWLGLDFDSGSLNFTAEYVGPVTSQQVEAFNAAFGGSTSLRRDTIGQFLRITESIGDDEIIGFGLYEGENADEPTEWRCLTRRDALRIAEEVQVLLGAGEAPHLPPASDRALAARMFGDRRDRHGEQNALERVRAVETGLTTRMERLEGQVEKNTGLIQDLHKQSTATESSVMGLLSTFENFCDQATQKIEQMAPRTLAAPVARIRAPRSRKPWIASAAAVLLVVGGSVAWYWVSPAAVVKAKQQTPAPAAERVEPPAAQPIVEVPPAAPVAKPAPVPGQVRPVSKPAAAEGPPMSVDLSATAPTWVSVRDIAGNTLMSQLLVPGADRSLTLTTSAILRAGNAGGLEVHLNGESIGPLGPAGQVRNLEFKNGKARLIGAP
jgi:hypothetical protein